MPIPGLKVLDDILAGLPTNAAQRKEIEELKKQIATLEKENGELKQSNELLRQASAALVAKKEDEMVRIGGAYFKKGPDGKAAGYPYCVPCWENNQKLSSITPLLGNVYRCPTCRNQSQPQHFGWPPEAKS